MSNNDKIKKAKIKMFRKDYGLRLFGARSYAFNWKVVDTNPNIEGFVRWHLQEEKYDGNIYINNLYLNKSDYDHDNLIALIIHELLHILHKHGQRQGTRIPELFAFAADHIIDRDLRHMQLKPYQNRFNIIKELDYELPNCSLIEAYNWLYEKRDRFNINKNNEISFTVTDSSNNQEYQVTYTPDDSSKLNEEETEKLKQVVEQFVSETRTLHQVMKEKGDSTGNIAEYLNKLLKVEIPWTELLEKAIKTNVILKPNERSWRKLNPNYFVHNITLPGISYDEEKENVGLLILGIDTSGSISKPNLEKFAYILSKSLKYFNEVVLLVHDIEVHQKVIFKFEDFGSVGNFIKNIGFKGRGGTSHIPIFNIIEKEYYNEQEQLDRLSMIIFLTDLESDVEYNIEKYNWSKSIPTVFLCTTNREFNKNGNIQTIKIKDE